MLLHYPHEEETINGEINPTGEDARGAFEALEGHRYVNLTTFRRSGQAVPTPVWFARSDRACTC